MYVLKKYLKFVLLVLFAYSFVVYAKTVSQGEDNFTDTSKPIYISAKSPMVTIKLKSNPTTGFMWSIVSYDHNIIQLLSSKYHRPNTRLIGAPGYHVFKFKVNKSALIKHGVSTKIQLQYARPWTAQQASPVTITVIAK